MLVPRHYQLDAVDSTFNYFASGAEGNPVIALPTGTGKSVVIADFCQKALRWYPGTRILIVTHVKELIEQNFLELVGLWPTAPAGIYSAGLKRRDIGYPITFCGIASIVDRIADFGHIDLVMVDECHLINPKADTMYARAIESLRNLNRSVRVIGLTATPYRMGMGLITEGGLFTDIVCDWTSLEKFNQLVEEGYIAPLIPRQPRTMLDVSGVGTSGGDYIQAELQAAVDKDSITRQAILEAMQLAPGRYSWLVFCTGSRHADHTAAILNEVGIPALALHSDMDYDPRFPPQKKGKHMESPRDVAIRVFKAGLIGALVSVGMVTTGFNHRPVDCILMLRPTKSPALWVQMLGRGTRPSPETGKRDCLVLDFAANTADLGPINDPKLPQKKGKKGTAGAPYKICPACSTYNHTRVTHCIYCGNEFPQMVKISMVASEHELIRKLPKPKEEPAPFAVFDVSRVSYAKHTSRDPAKPPSLRITYHCGLRIFHEYLSLEHPVAFPRHNARDKWRLFEKASNDGAPTDTPDTVDEALQRLDKIAIPTQVKVFLRQKYPEVVGYSFGLALVELPGQTAHV